MSASGPSPLFYSSLFAHPQPPLGFVWAPTTLKGAKPRPRADNQHEMQRHEREVERTYLMGSCGKYVLPRVRLAYREKRSAMTASSGSSSFEPPLVLVASSPNQAGWGDDCSTTNTTSYNSNLQFVAMPGDVLWEECPSIVFTDTTHLATLMAGFNETPNKENRSGNRNSNDKRIGSRNAQTPEDEKGKKIIDDENNVVKAEEKEKRGGPHRMDVDRPSPLSIPQGLAAVWSMLMQKEKEGGAASQPTHPSSFASAGGASQQQHQKIQLEYGRGFSAIFTGLAETIRSRQGKDDDRPTAKNSGEQSPPVVEVCSSLQDGLSSIGFYQSAAVWRTLRKLERKSAGLGGDNDAGTTGSSQGGGSTTAENVERLHASVGKLIAPPALAASVTSLLGISSSSSALYSFSPAPPLMSLDRYFSTKDAASGPTAVLTMVQKVLARCAAVDGSNGERSVDEVRGDEAGERKKGGISCGSGTTAGDGTDIGHTHVKNTITRPLFEVGARRAHNSAKEEDEEEYDSITSGAFACLWRLCQERSLLLLKDPDGATEGTNLAGEEIGGDTRGVGGASSILKGLIAAQQQKGSGRGDDGKSGGGGVSTVEEALSAFCPIAAMANYTKLSAIANAQLVIVQQAMPIVYAARSRNGGGEGGGEEEGEVGFRYRFVVQAVATRPIRRGEEIRLPMHLLASSAASIPTSIVGASTASNTSLSSSRQRVARPAIGLASSTHLSLALKQITDAIAKNSTASATAATRSKKGMGGGGGGGDTHAPSVDGSLGNGGGNGSGSDSLGRISPYCTDVDYRRHLEKVRGSLEQYLRHAYVGGALGNYLSRSHTSKMKAGELLEMMQRAAVAKAGGGI